MEKDILVDILISTDKIASTSFVKRKRIYTFLNPVSYLDALKHKELFLQFDGIFADGTLVVKMIKTFYHRRIEKREFDMSSMAKDLFNYAVEKDKSIYIIASKQEEIEKAVDKIKKEYPNLKIIGFRSGYFKNAQEELSVISQVISFSPDYLIVGMGAVKQEEFLLKAKNSGFEGIGFTCGGFITQTANYAEGIDYFPEWTVRYNVRFVYRLFKEPHTRTRYLKAAFLFPYRFVLKKYGL